MYLITKNIPNTGISVKYDGWNVFLSNITNDNKINNKPTYGIKYENLNLNFLFSSSRTANKEPINISQNLEKLAKKLKAEFNIVNPRDREKNKIIKIKKYLIRLFLIML